MRFLLDTDHISILQRQSGSEYAALITRISRVPRSDLVLCIVSFHEQPLGCNTFIARAKTPNDVVRGYEMFDRLLSTFAAAPVLPFNKSASTVFDALVASHLQIGTMDLRIASIALSRGLTLLSRNTRDFGRVPNLDADDWTL
jgi:tRNA(fMet)-specific endonuclease VapC